MTRSPHDYISLRREVLAQVRQLLIESLQLDVDPSEIDPDVPLFGTGLGLDSIDAVDLIIALGARFDVGSPGEESATRYLRTVNTLVDLVMDAKRHEEEA